MEITLDGRTLITQWWASAGTEPRRHMKPSSGDRIQLPGLVSQSLSPSLPSHHPPPFQECFPITSGELTAGMEVQHHMCNCLFKAAAKKQCYGILDFAPSIRAFLPSMCLTAHLQKPLPRQHVVHLHCLALRLGSLTQLLLDF